MLGVVRLQSLARPNWGLDVTHETYLDRLIFGNSQISQHQLTCHSRNLFGSAVYFVFHKTSQHQPTYVTHQTYLDRLFVLSFTKPLRISRHMSLRKPIWISCQFCLSQNLSASADIQELLRREDSYHINFLKHFLASWTLLSTLCALIGVHARLFFLDGFAGLHGLIRVCTFIF